MIDYAKMAPGEMYQALGCDALKWAEAFCQMNPEANMDEGVMLGWFANAMMAQVDFQDGKQPVLCGDHAQWLIDGGQVLKGE